MIYAKLKEISIFRNNKTFFTQRYNNPISKVNNNQKTTNKFKKIIKKETFIKIKPINALPFDLAWAPNIDQESIAPTLFALSLFPYIGFLYHLTRSKQAPKLALFGFYFLLVFVGISIPAGIYAKIKYHTSLSNVDYLHGGAESFLTITNLMIALGMKMGIDAKNLDKIEKEENLN